MHLLITGGEGYIGNYLTRSFLDDGHFVTTIDNHFTKKEFDFSMYPMSKLRRFNASVANPDIVSKAMQGVDIVFHLASRGDFSNSYRHPFRLATTNVEGTTNLLCMARKAGIDKVVFTSSHSVYGNLVGAKETDPCSPINMEGATKLAAEAIYRGFYQQGLDIIILRLFSVWGGKISNSVINKFCNCSDIIYSDGFQTRDFVHISDVIQALKSSISWDSGIYNIGSGEESTINAIWGMIKDNKKPIYKEFEPGYDEQIRICADISYVSKLWKPEVLLSELNREHIVRLCNV